MLELRDTAKEIEKCLAMSRKGFGDGWSEFREAEKSYDKLVQIRKQLLQNTLREKELAVCSELHFFSDGSETEEWKNKSAEQLGIFPKDAMGLRYVQGVIGTHDHFTMDEGEYPVIEVKLLCSEHFPKTYVNVYGTKEVPTLYDEVVQEGNRFILKSSGDDITKLVNSGDSSRSTIKLDGDTNPDLSVYRYFDIPDLPEKPNLDSVR
jgi:hypothetical protein